MFLLFAQNVLSIVERFLSQPIDLAQKIEHIAPNNCERHAVLYWVKGGNQSRFCIDYGSEKTLIISKNGRTLLHVVKHKSRDTHKPVDISYEPLACIFDNKVRFRDANLIAKAKKLAGSEHEIVLYHVSGSDKGYICLQFFIQNEKDVCFTNWHIYMSDKKSGKMNHTRIRFKERLSITQEEKERAFH